MALEDKLDNHSSVMSLPNGSLREHRFIFLSVTNACLTFDSPAAPVELSVLVFSFNKGEISHFHRIVIPSLPPCYAYDSIYSERFIHSIPVDETLEFKYDELWDQLREYIENHTRNRAGHAPALYAKSPSLVDKTLRWLYDRAHATDHVNQGSGSSAPRFGSTSRYPFARIRQVEDLLDDLNIRNNQLFLTPDMIHNAFELEFFGTKPLDPCKHHYEVQVKLGGGPGSYRVCSLAMVRVFANVITKFARQVV